MRSQNKYHSVPTEVDGIKFASMKEARRYEELRLLLHAKKIDRLKFHPPYPIVVAGEHIATYYADFQYWDIAKGEEIIEDVKGIKTQVYKLKKKLVETIYTIKITEIA